MRTCRAIIKKIDVNDEKLSKEFVDEFLNDLVRYEGSTINLYDFEIKKTPFGGTYYNFKVRNENGIVWDDLYLTGDFWYADEPEEEFNKMFRLVVSSELPDDLFEM